MSFVLGMGGIALHGGWAQGRGGHALMKGGGYTFANAEAEALVARFDVQPTNARKALIDTLVGSLKTAGVWDKLDALYVLAAHDAQAAQRNWIADAFNLTPQNSPTFETDRGYTGDGSTSYLDTGFNPTTASSPKFTQNDAHMGVWLRTDLDKSGGPSYEIGANGKQNIAKTGSTGVVALKPNLAGTGNVADAAPGHSAWTRSGAAVWEGYAQGVDAGGGTDASEALINLTWRVCAAAGTGTFGVNQVAAGHWGSNLTASEVGDLYDALHAYFSGLTGFF